jgi:MATE family multidrug resistance protein
MTFETGAFSSCAIFAGWLGTVSLAAFQVTIVVSTLGFCIYYSIGTAIAVTVANDAGRGSLRDCRRSAFSGYAVMLVFAALSSAALAMFGRPLMHLFSDDTAVLALAGTVIIPLLLYQLGDATQIAFSNALRGTSKVMPMVWIAFVSYMMAGLPSTYLLAFTAGLGIYGLVLSFSVSLFLAAALFLYFFMRATRPKEATHA